MGLSKADQSRSDSIDIQHFSLDLDFTQMNAFQISGVCEVSFTALLEEVNHLSMDLLGMEISEVFMDEEPLNFDYSSPLLVIQLPQTLSPGDTGTLSVHYSGQAQMDASGWGGFYFQNNQAFNLGVGFDADPHNFGRAWYPCFDNFLERSTYDIQVLSNNGNRAYCSGELMERTLLAGDSTTDRWSISTPIPSYLVGIAVGNYTHTEDAFQSISGEEVPIWLAALPQDTSSVQASFVNLIPCLEAFEEDYGPYLWNRVGYVMVPFSSGAMEHATNIAYPAAFADGSLTYETLMAHELAHHWWGDLVTCSSQEDMWINEGMASYAESLFLEEVYGESDYWESVLDNHKDVLLYAHRNDGERLPVSGIGHAFTYGDHVYNKGATIAHNLRNLMGDEAYFTASKDFLNDHQFSDVSSIDILNYFQNYTPQNVQSFFDAFIFQEGFPDFFVSNWSSSEVENSNDLLLTINIAQQSHYNPNSAESTPLFVEVIGVNGESYFEQVVYNPNSNIEVQLPFEAKWVYLNDERILQASLSEEILVNDNGITNFDRAELRLDVETIGSEALWMRVENHWSTAEVEDDPSLFLSNDRFWRVLGDFGGDFEATARIRYYGNPTAGNYFDPKFFAAMDDLNIPEDSLKLFFRPLNGNTWEAHPFELGVQGNNTNYQGQIEFPLSAPGDYAWGINSDYVGMEPLSEPELLPYPNPAQDYISFQLNEAQEYRVLNALGELVLSGHTEGRISVQHLNPGAYFIQMGKSTFPFIKK